MMGAFVKSCRPREWTKNVLVFAGIVFSGHLFEPDYMLRALAAFVLFSFTASSIYLLNDLADREKDRAHPKKKHRPIASGALPAGAAVAGIALLALPSFLAGFWLGREFGIALVLYFAINVAYSYKLKHSVIIDVLIISLGFLIRAVAGVEALRSIDPAVVLSPWLLVCTFFASLFLAVAKRRSEILLLESDAGAHRASLMKYSPALIDQIMSVTVGATVLSYALYTIWPDTVAKFGTDRLIYTVPFVAYGLFRYSYLVFQKGMGGNPAETLLADRAMGVNILLWLGAVLAILYVGA
jgi:4-hydroxybenzoate polyprenyltransferase